MGTPHSGTIERTGGQTMAKVQVMEHPLIQHKMSYIRDEKTSTKEFRELVDEVGMLMAYEVTRNCSRPG